MALVVLLAEKREIARLALERFERDLALVCTSLFVGGTVVIWSADDVARAALENLLGLTALRFVAVSHGLLDPIGGGIYAAKKLSAVPETLLFCSVVSSDRSSGSVEHRLSDKYVGEQLPQKRLQTWPGNVLDPGRLGCRVNAELWGRGDAGGVLRPSSWPTSDSSAKMSLGAVGVPAWKQSGKRPRRRKNSTRAAKVAQESKLWPLQSTRRVSRTLVMCSPRPATHTAQWS